MIQGLLILEEEIVFYHLLGSLNDIIKYANLSSLDVYVRPTTTSPVIDKLNDINNNKINNNSNINMKKMNYY